jgi:magnesium-transporting ATPase (P-type)
MPLCWLDLILSFAGDSVTPESATVPHATALRIRRRFQFSSALKRMSTVSTLPNGSAIAAVKGAPETIKTMLATVPENYDATYKWFTRRGSRVLALGIKNLEGNPSPEKVKAVIVFTHLSRLTEQCRLTRWRVARSKAS